MNLKELRTTPHNILINELTEATAKGNQDMINILSYELVCRFYVPGNGEKTFEEMLFDFGYRIKEKNNEENYTKKLK